MPTFLVTGANRGIGLELTRQVAQRGDGVIAACRNPAAAAPLSVAESADGNAGFHFSSSRSN